MAEVKTIEVRVRMPAPIHELLEEVCRAEGCTLEEKVNAEMITELDMQLEENRLLRMKSGLRWAPEYREQLYALAEGREPEEAEAQAGVGA